MSARKYWLEMQARIPAEGIGLEVMFMQLTAEQQRKVEENMGLVGKVIKDKVHNPEGIFSYRSISS